MILLCTPQYSGETLNIVQCILGLKCSFSYIKCYEQQLLLWGRIWLWSWGTLTGRKSACRHYGTTQLGCSGASKGCLTSWLHSRRGRGPLPSPSLSFRDTRRPVISSKALNWGRCTLISFTCRWCLMKESYTPKQWLLLAPAGGASQM